MRKLFNGNKKLLSQRIGKETQIQLSADLTPPSALVSSSGSRRRKVRPVILINIVFRVDFLLFICSFMYSIHFSPPPLLHDKNT